MENYNQGTPEEPEAKIRVNGQEFLARRENTSLFRHLGKHAIFDHVFLQTGENEGAYIFNHVGGYEELSDYMMQNGYPMHVNLPEASPLDQDAYMRAATQDLGDSFPEDWEAEGKDA